MSSSWGYDMSVDTVVASNLHPGSYRDLEPSQGEPTKVPRLLWVGS